MPTSLRMNGPVELTTRQPTIIRIRPGIRRSLLLSPPSPYTIAFGGVLITKATPSEDEIAIRIAVDGSGLIVPARGIRIVAVAVLLISAESEALATQSRTSTMK